MRIIEENNHSWLRIIRLGEHIPVEMQLFDSQIEVTQEALDQGMFVAACGDKRRVIDLLFEAGAKGKSYKDGQAVYVAEGGRLSKLKEFVERRGADPTAADSLALQKSVMGAHFKTATYLMTKGASMRAAFNGQSLIELRKKIRTTIKRGSFTP